MSVTVADVVVIGGGVVGAACTEALSRRRLSVALVERLGLAAGTSSACQSGVGHGIFADAYDLALDRAAIEEYRALVADGVNADYSRNGALLICGPAEESPVRARLTVLNAIGLRTEWLDAAALREAEPALAPGYAGAALLNDMGQVSPMRLVAELVARACARGAVVHTHSEVTGIDVERGGVAAVRTSHGAIATREVVVAAGVWSRDIARKLSLDVPIWPLKGHVLVTEPSRGLIRRYLTAAEYEVAASSFSEARTRLDEPPSGPPRTAAVLQPLPSGQILIGSSREFASDREVDRVRLGQIARKAARLVPALAERRIIRTYAGLRPWTPDGRPLIGRTARLSGVTFASGHGGEGNTRSLLTGRLVADIIAGGRPHIDIAPLSPDRFDLGPRATAA